MEDFNIFGNDFLSNGEFHQLYTTFDHQDEFNLWDNRIDIDLQPKWNYLSDYSIEQSTSHSSFNFTNNFANEIESMPTNNGYNSEYLYNFGESEKYCTQQTTQNTLITDMDEWKQTHLEDLIYQSNSTNEWDLNLENLLMDNTCDESAFSVCDLPARTLFCNDSCTNFLQETSEQLDTSFRTFQPSATQNSTTFVNPPSNSSYVDRKKFQAINSEEKEFICSYGDCRKVYAKAGHLKAHIRRHIGDKPYVCQWPNCTWKFSRSDELSRHRRSHSGVKPYHCDLCPKCFSRSDHLTKHRKVHERKMAAMKIKTIWTKLPPRKPGRKPKSQTSNQ